MKNIKIEVIQSNGSLFLEKPMLKIKRITFYLGTNLKKYSIYNFKSKIDKKFERNFLKFKFKGKVFQKYLKNLSKKKQFNFKFSSYRFFCFKFFKYF